MNLQLLAGNITAGLSPWITCSYLQSTGYSTASSGKRTPSYADPVDIQAKVQSLTFNDITQLNGLNIQGERRALYVSGTNVKGIVREEGRGGDLITLPDGTTWLVAHVLENWFLTSGWVKVAITRQVEN